MKKSQEKYWAISIVIVFIITIGYIKYCTIFGGILGQNITKSIECLKHKEKCNNKK